VGNDSFAGTPRVKLMGASSAMTDTPRPNFMTGNGGEEKTLSAGLSTSVQRGTILL
jgi:hypothetical protein